MGRKNNVFCGICVRNRYILKIIGIIDNLVISLYLFLVLLYPILFLPEKIINIYLMCIDLCIILLALFDIYEKKIEEIEKQFKLSILYISSTGNVALNKEI